MPQFDPYVGIVYKYLTSKFNKVMEDFKYCGKIGVEI